MVVALKDGAGEGRTGQVAVGGSYSLQKGVLCFAKHYRNRLYVVNGTFHKDGKNPHKTTSTQTSACVLVALFRGNK
jgi:hypothetical protein